MYKEKLIAILEGLECQEIPDLIEKSPEFLRKIAFEVTKYAKTGAAQQKVEAEATCKECGDTYDRVRFCHKCEAIDF